MWTRLLDGTLRRAVRCGSLEVEFPDGRARRHGHGGEAVRFALHDPALPRRMLLNADLALGGAWMDGTLMRPVEALGLETTDVEVWPMHYAETLRHWYERFVARAEEAERLYDARFVRMWRWYLAGCETNVRRYRQAVFQVQLARRKDAVPITRACLHPAAEGALRAAEWLRTAAPRCRRRARRRGPARRGRRPRRRAG